MSEQEQEIKSEYQQFKESEADHGKHSSECESANHKRCRCWCGGRLHGSKSGFLAQVDGKMIGRGVSPDAKLMSYTDGGDVAEKIKEFDGVKFRCIGICGKELAASPIYGYPDHDAGEEDRRGRKWWLFIHCPFCAYETALWKINHRRIGVQ